MYKRGDILKFRHYGIESLHFVIVFKIILPGMYFVRRIDNKKNSDKNWRTSRYANEYELTKIDPLTLIVVKRKYKIE